MPEVRIDGFHGGPVPQVLSDAVGNARRRPVRRLGGLRDAGFDLHVRGAGSAGTPEAAGDRGSGQLSEVVFRGVALPGRGGAKEDHRDAGGQLRRQTGSGGSGRPDRENGRDSCGAAQGQRFRKETEIGLFFPRRASPNPRRKDTNSFLEEPPPSKGDFREPAITRNAFTELIAARSWAERPGC